jgi:hypothetical protein
MSAFIKALSISKSSYFMMKYTLNLLVVKYKFSNFTDKDLTTLDSFISKRLKHENLSSDYFSFLHLIIQVQRSITDSSNKHLFLNTTKAILRSISQMNLAKYSKMEGESQDEFERIA